MLKKPKEQVLSEINSRAMAACSYNLQQNLGHAMHMDSNSVAYALQSAIATAITEGFKVLLENQYTDEMFENDIGLKP